MEIICYRFHLSLENSIFMLNPEGVYGKDPDKLKANKNQLFLDALYKTVDSIENSSENASYNAHIFYNNLTKKRILLRFGLLGSSKIISKDLTTKITLPNWQHYINIFISADENFQIIGIENKTCIPFSLVEEKLFQPIRKILREELFELHIVPMCKESSFWDFVNEYQGYIKQLSLTLFAPNLSFATSSVDKDMERLRGSFSAYMVNLTAKSNKSQGSLIISKDNPYTQGISRIISTGLGKAEVRAKDPKLNIMKKFSSSNSSIATSVTSAKLEDIIQDGVVSNEDQLEEIFDKIDDTIGDKDENI